MGVPDHLICFLRNLCSGQETTVRTWHRTSDWFKLGKEYKAVYCHPVYLIYMQSTCVLSRFNHVWLFATLWIIARHASVSKGYSRQEYWSGLPCSPRGDLSDPRIEPVSLKSSALVGGFFTTNTNWETLYAEYIMQNARLDDYKLKSRLWGEISTTSDLQMIPL